MPEEPLKSAEEWLLEYPGLVILDPDGWDRSPEGWEASWNERITRAEFDSRAAYSTCSWPRSLLFPDAK